MSRPILLLSEVFPPTVGGSGALLWNTYSRIESVPVHVITDNAGGQETPASGARLDVTHRPLRYRSWGLANPAGLLNHLSITRSVRRLARTSSAIHCARILPEGLDAMLSGLVTPRPFVCWMHGEELGFIKSSRELTWLARRVIERSAALIANSHNTAGMLKDQLDAPTGKVHVIHPGVDAERFQPDLAKRAALRKRLAPNDELVLLTVGRLQRRKGHDLVLAALAELALSFPAIRYVIVGDGEERVRLERLVTDYGMGGRVTFAGATTAGELPDYYAAADIFVHPNRVEGDDFEGFGIVFLEAAACGLPVIGGSTGGVPEAIAEGKTGLLVSGTDATELRTALARLACAEPLRRDMGRAGRARAISEFSWTRGAAQLLKIHEETTAMSYRSPVPGPQASVRQ